MGPTDYIQCVRLIDLTLQTFITFVVSDSDQNFFHVALLSRPIAIYEMYACRNDDNDHMINICKDDDVDTTRKSFLCSWTG